MANSLKICNECHNKPVRCKGLCRTCYSRKINRKLRSQTGISITRLQKGWVQNSGSHKGYQVRDETKEWCCQACGEKQSAKLDPYLFPFMENEVIRICALCQNIVVRFDLKEFYQLKKQLRLRT